MLQCAFPYDKIVKNTKFFHFGHRDIKTNLIDVFYRYAHKCATKNQIFALFRRILCPKLSINCSIFHQRSRKNTSLLLKTKYLLSTYFRVKKPAARADAGSPPARGRRAAKNYPIYFLTGMAACSETGCIPAACRADEEFPLVQRATS